jgi:hypothetical protein
MSRDIMVTQCANIYQARVAHMTTTYRGIFEAPTPTPPQSAAPYVGVIELHLGAVQSRASRQFT